MRRISIDVESEHKLSEDLTERLKIYAGVMLPPKGEERIKKNEGCPPNIVRHYGRMEEGESIESIRALIEESVPGILVTVKDWDDA